MIESNCIYIDTAPYIYYLEKNKILLDDFGVLLEDTGTDIIDITKPIAKRAAEIRAYYSRFKAMDALQLAAAVMSGCNVFLTNDKQLRQFAEIKVITMGDL